MNKNIIKDIIYILIILGISGSVYWITSKVSKLEAGIVKTEESRRSQFLTTVDILQASGIIDISVEGDQINILKINQITPKDENITTGTE